MTDSAEIMPAATSHEDIYNQTSGSNSLSSSFCSSTSYLPDYMMMFKDPSHQHPLLDRTSCGSLKHINNIHSLKEEQLNSSNQKQQQQQQQQQSTDNNQLKKNHHNHNNLTNYPQQQKQQNLPATNNTYLRRHHHQQQNNCYSPYQTSSDYIHSKISVCYDDGDGDGYDDGDDDDDVDYVYADDDHDGDDEDEVRETNFHDDILYSNAPISMKEISDNNNQYLTNNQMYQETMTPHYLTIEELKSALTSCWLCGCNWQQDHVSLDCPECGGYALSRPCPSCDGQCKQMWKRNINGTHDRHKASWVGECTIASSSSSATIISDKHKPQISIGCYNQDHGDASGIVVGKSDIMSRSTNGSNKLNAVVGNVTIASSVCSSQPSSAASSDSELECQHDQIQLGNNQKQQQLPVLDQSASASANITITTATATATATATTAPTALPPTTTTTATASTSSQLQSKSQQHQRQYKIEAN